MILLLYTRYTQTLIYAVNILQVNILQVIYKIFFGIILKRTIFSSFPWCFGDAWLSNTEYHGMITYC